MPSRTRLMAGAAVALLGALMCGEARAQEFSPEEVQRIGQQSKLVERDRIELEGRFEAMEAAQKSGSCGIFRLWNDSINRFLDKQIGDYGAPTGLPVRRNVFQAAETRLARIVALGCPPVSTASPATPVDAPQAVVPDISPPAGSTGTPVEPGPAGPPPQIAPPAPGAERSSLIGARAAVRRAGERCDAAAYLAAKARLLALLDALIADEPDSDRSGALIRERAEVRRLMTLDCNPEEDILDEIGEDAPPLQTPSSSAPVRTSGQAIVATDHLTALRQELDKVRIGDLYEQQFGVRPPNIRTRAEIEADIKEAEFNQRIDQWSATDNLFIFGSFGTVDQPETGIGFRRDGPSGEAPEEFAETTGEQVSTRGFGIEFGLGSAITVKMGYVEGDTARRFDISGNNGTDSGTPYGGLSPAESSGVATPFGLIGTIGFDFKHYGAEVAVSLVRQPTTSNAGPGGFDLRVYGSYTRTERDYVGNASYSGGSGFIFEFSQDRRQALDESFFDLGLDGRLTVPLGSRVFGHLIGVAGAYYRDGTLKSVERNQCNFCPLSDRDFTLAIDDDDDGIGFRGRAGVTLEFAVAPRVSIIIGGAAEYRSAVGAIFNPNSGDQVFFDGLTTELRRRSSHSLFGFAGVGFRF